MNVKFRVSKLEAQAANSGNDDIAELFEKFCELKGYALPDKLPSRADIDAIIKNAIGSALRPYSSERK